jgi:hypothetical protein
MNTILREVMPLLLITSLFLVSPQDSAWATLMGISQDDTLVAYREDITRAREDGTHDQFSLIHTLDSTSGYRVATFRASSIHRLSHAGRPLKLSKAKLRHDNPRFAEAYPYKRWASLKKRKAFKKTQATIDGDIVALRCDSDTKCQKEQNGHVVHLAAPQDEALGFGITLTSPNNESTSVVSARLPGQQGQRLAAKGEFYVSSKGRVSVLVTNFLSRRGQDAVAIPQIQIAYSRETQVMARALRPTQPRRASLSDPSKIRVRVQDSQDEQAHLRAQRKEAMAKLTTKEKRILRRRQHVMNKMVAQYTGRK